MDDAQRSLTKAHVFKKKDNQKGSKGPEIKPSDRIYSEYPKYYSLNSTVDPLRYTWHPGSREHNLLSRTTLGRSLTEKSKQLSVHNAGAKEDSKDIDSHTDAVLNISWLTTEIKLQIDEFSKQLPMLLFKTEDEMTQEEKDVINDHQALTELLSYLEDSPNECLTAELSLT